MTYCAALNLKDGLVFASDSRTNAGVDHINTFRKMSIFQRPGERVMVLMGSGNLAITQQLVSMLREAMAAQDGRENLWSVPNMFEAARHVGETLREVHRRDSDALQNFGIDFTAALILGGQIGREPPRLFHIYAAGNFIEATPDTPYFQIGESKYGKPIIDRVVKRHTSLDEAATGAWTRTEFASAAAIKRRVKGQSKAAVTLAEKAFDAAMAMTPCLVVVPGNHDIPLFDLVSRLTRPFSAYAASCGERLEPSYSLPDLFITGVNSVRPWRHKQGSLAAVQVEAVAQRLRRAGRSAMRVVVVHHPLDVGEGVDPGDIVLGAAEAVSAWAGAGADLVMSGHVHLPLCRALAVRYGPSAGRCWVAVAGTAVSGRTRRGWLTATSSRAT